MQNFHRRHFLLKERGQAMSEFALVMPILVLLLAGMIMAGMYAFRAAAADWGVFIVGVGAGTYNTPASELARKDILWPDIRERINTGTSLPRQVRSTIAIEDSHPWAFGINLIEAQRGNTNFRLWRFYPGPPPPGVNE
jgi:hypothetical protein